MAASRDTNLSRKNELGLLEIRGEIKLLGQQIDTIKNNDLVNIQELDSTKLIDLKY